MTACGGPVEAPGGDTFTFLVHVERGCSYMLSRREAEFYGSGLLRAMNSPDWLGFADVSS